MADKKVQEDIALEMNANNTRDASNKQGNVIEESDHTSPAYVESQEDSKSCTREGPANQCSWQPTLGTAPRKTSQNLEREDRGETAGVDGSATSPRHNLLPVPKDRCSRAIDRIQTRVYNFWDRCKKPTKYLLLGVTVVTFFVYLGFAIHRSVRDSAALIVLSVFVTIYVLTQTLLKNFCGRCQRALISVRAACRRGHIQTVLKW